MTAFFFVGIGLGSYAILDNNEGLYSEISREMLRSGDWHQWVIPHLNGLAYMEKPPLLYWLTALFFAVFGESEWSARLVPALSALSCVGLLLWFGRKLGRPQSVRLAAIMFISGLGVMAMSRTLMFDMLLTALLTAALMWAYFFVVDHDARTARFSYAFLALAVMAKGFIAIILFCAVIGSFILSQSTSVKDFFIRLGRCGNWKAIGIFLLIVLPWHIVAVLTEPIFAWFYFINEHVLRFLGKREPHDYYAGAWWYYLPRMVLYLFPWSFLVLGVFFAKKNVEQTDLVGQAEQAGSAESQSSRPLTKQLQWFLSLAWLMPMLFFSISSAKANYYLVTVMPLASFQLALLLENRQYGGRWGRLLPGLLLAILFGGLAWFLFRHPQEKLDAVQIMGLSANQFLLYALLALVFVAAISGISAWRWSRVGILAYVLLPMASLFIFLNVLHVSAEWTSARPIADVLKSEYSERKIFLFQIFEDQSSLAFYLKKPIYIIESRSSDLFWGNKLHKNNIALSSSDFEHVANTSSLAVVVLNRDVALFTSKTYSKNFRLSQKFANVSLFLN
ncbi:glycosyltransferase family 39 protein [Undibacterium sp. RTI2.1]|uniref:ArnT family glycosyltransferase n=1 Tax=unclassified Undibacterium TaxID=2630295 RepID=UPI002AB388F9|nr:MULTISPECIES: glycosyltransferase family 39 protein [unclassified Undibacterium]MDY7537978.1 glycosyltransferase family 39 protein [Undibacterium sp. 5I1]MEB0032043.1 glycosyltransferase family 39 protein [Undibacterium sp. RTI2.1]MEB0117239.1 glycosyltransferase family 39 protein [Undibacterium sp. RTI2.2]MEB0231068.1 glycosyltransferase family 39 protein [Undibacterium sp. 10I3]MEB0257533.1 glycosyltransferase family 39 protein [Undibacterium sp. 5I1]